MTQFSSLSLALVVTVGGAGCTNGLLPTATLDGLPVAVLHCPDHVAVGAAFVVDGSDSVDVGGTWAETTLTLSSFDGSVFQQEDALDGEFVVDHGTVVTVALHVKDDDGNVALAACRVIVDGAGEEGEEGEGEGAVDDEFEFDLTGHFALVTWDAAEVSTFGLNPATQCAPAKAVAFVDVRQVQNHVSFTMKTCSLSVVAVDSFIGRQASTFASAAVQALPSLIGEFDIDGAGSEFTGIDGDTALVIGADVGAGDPLPTDSTLENVVDDDGDGAPGVTMHTTDEDGASVDDHAVVYRRTIKSFSGTIDSADEVNGDWQVDGETSLLDDWANLLTPQTTGRPSTFKMTRTAATSCADLDTASAPAPAAIDMADCYIAQ